MARLTQVPLESWPGVSGMPVPVFLLLIPDERLATAGLRFIVGDDGLGKVLSVGFKLSSGNLGVLYRYPDHGPRREEWKLELKASPHLREDAEEVLTCLAVEPYEITWVADSYARLD